MLKNMRKIFEVRECQLLVARNEAEAHTTLMDEYIRAVYRLLPFWAMFIGQILLFRETRRELEAAKGGNMEEV